MRALDYIGFGQRICVIVAHPDDETLGCGGTIRRLADQGAAVSVLAVTDGGQARAPEFYSACEHLGAIGRTLAFPAGRLTLDMDLVAAIDTELRDNCPHVVLTHAATEAQHQDHATLRRAVERSLYRGTEPVLALGAEPPAGASGWVPSVFADITATIDAKAAAAQGYAATAPRRYLTRRSIEARASYWGLVSGSDPARHVEAFDLLLWR